MTGGGYLVRHGRLVLTGRPDQRRRFELVRGKRRLLDLAEPDQYTETDNTTFESHGGEHDVHLLARSTSRPSRRWDRCPMSGMSEALAGGTLNLSGSDRDQRAQRNALQITANGSGSQLNLSAVTSISGDGSSIFVVTTSGTTLASSLTSFSDIRSPLMAGHGRYQPVGQPDRRRQSDGHGRLVLAAGLDQRKRFEPVRRGWGNAQLTEPVHIHGDRQYDF